MITVDQAYNFVFGCPMQNTNKSPVATTPVDVWMRENFLDVFLATFEHRNIAELQKQINEQMDKVYADRKQIMPRKNAITLLMDAAMNMYLFVSSTLEGYFKKGSQIRNEDYKMIGEIHAFRLKPNDLGEIIWLNFATTMPNEELKNYLYFYANWNARIFELISKVRPFSLKIYFVNLDYELNLQYNFENRLEVVSYLIDNQLLFTRPERKRCLLCKQCNEYLRYTHGKRNNS